MRKRRTPAAGRSARPGDRAAASAAAPPEPFSPAANLPAGALTAADKRSMLTVFGVTFAAAFAAYWLTLAPGLSGQDSGELISSAYLLGIAHPPGYPLWCMLGKAATFIPVRDAAFRINMLSALFGAATAGIVAVLCFMLSRSTTAAVCAGLCLAFSQLVWSLSVVAQTKTLNTFFLVLILLLLFIWDRRRTNGLLYATAFIYGLSCTNHSTMWPLGPLFLAYVLARDWRLPFRQPRVPFICALLVLTGLAVYLYLPIRSAADTYMNWGNPRTLDDTLFHILRKQYPSPGTESPRSLALLIRQMGRLLDFVFQQFTPALAWLIVVGIVEQIRQKDYLRFLLLGAVWGMTSVGFVVLTNFKIEFQEILVNSVFFVSSLPVAAIWLGLGVKRVLIICTELGRRAAPGFSEKTLRWGTAVCVPLVPFLAHYEANDYSRYYFAYDYGMNILETMEHDALFFPSGDHSSFTVMYLQAVERRRPDVTIADKYGYIEPSLYKGMGGLRSRFPDKNERADVERWIIEHTTRPVYFTTKRDMSDLPGYRVAPVGILYRVFRPKEQVHLHPETWTEYHWRNLEGVPCQRDYTANVVLSDVHYFKGLLYLEQNRVQAAMEEFRQVMASAQDMKEVYNNLGSICAEKELLQLAIYFYDRAVQINPRYLTARRNLAFVHKQLGHTDEAIEHFKRAAALAPNNLTYPMELASLLETKGEKEEAITIFERLARLDPKNYFFFTRLGFLYRDYKHNPDAAVKQFRRALELNPDQPEVQTALKQLGR